MKLYLSSIGIPNSNALLSLIDPKELSVAIIPNAWDVYPVERKQEETAKTKTLFVNCGFKVSFLDLARANETNLNSSLSNQSLIWIMGGNSFYLNELIHISGLANIINGLLEKGLVYGGESAGATIAGMTLHGVELLDDPAKASQVIWEGLGLVEFGIVPHWGMEKYAKLLERCQKEMTKYAETKTLTNSQAIVINGDGLKIVEA